MVWVSGLLSGEQQIRHSGGGLDLDPMVVGPGRRYVIAAPQLLHSAVFGVSMSPPDSTMPFARSCIVMLAMCSCSACAPAMIFVAMTHTMVVRASVVPLLSRQWGGSVSIVEARIGAVPNGQFCGLPVLSAVSGLGARRQVFQLATVAVWMPMLFAMAAL